MPRSYRQLTLDDRRTIFRLLDAKVPLEEIARQLGRHRSTIHREITRNLFREVKEYRGYYPLTADDSAKRRRQRRRKLVQDAQLRAHVIEKLELCWSPEQIAGRLKLTGGDDCLCHETIYQFVYSPEGRAAGAAPPPAPGQAAAAPPLRPQAARPEDPARADHRPAPGRDR